MTGMTYPRARALILTAGIALLLLTAGVMALRGVDPVEVGGTLLFIPVFLGLLFWKIPGGLGGAVLAALGYVALRYSSIKAVGFGEISGLVLSRSAAYVAFGLLGGWASRQLEASLSKLELYDQIDDATGLYNARFLLTETDLEMSRSRRYQSIFSVALVDIAASAVDGLARRPRAALLRDVGRILKDSVRTVDRAVHGRGSDRHKLAVILPETGKEGAQIFARRLADKIVEHIGKRGLEVAREDVSFAAYTYPDDEEGLKSLRQDFTLIDRIEHPEQATPPAP